MGQAMDYQGHIKDGVVVFNDPLPLPDGTPVRISAVPVNDFWQSKSLEELAAEQGVVMPDTVERLIGGWPDDELDDGFETAYLDWRQAELER